MITQKIKIGIIALLLFVQPGLYGQSLDALMLLATQNNPELKSLEFEYQASLEKAPQISQLPDPEASAGLFVLPPETRVGPQMLRIGARQMFPWKGTLKAREKVAKTKAQVKFTGIEARKLELFFELKQAYFQFYELYKSLEIVEINLELLESMSRFALAKVESGKGSSVDVLRIEMKIKELEKEFELLNIRMRKPLAVISRVINRPLDALTIKEDLQMAEIALHSDSLLSIFKSSHPALKSFALQQNVSKAALRLNKLEAKPSFGVGLDYIVVGQRSDAEVNKNGQDILMPKASLKIPLYHKKYDAKQREEQFKIAALEHDKQHVESRFTAILKQAFAELEEARVSLELYEELKRTTRAALDILETDYANSGQRFDEMLLLQMDLVNYDLEILKTIVKSHIAKAKVEKYINRI